MLVHNHRLLQEWVAFTCCSSTWQPKGKICIPIVNISPLVIMQAFRVGLIALAIFTVILLAATFGLTWAVVAVLKDTRVRRARHLLIIVQATQLFWLCVHVARE